jgi:hypothetical protein
MKANKTMKGQAIPHKESESNIDSTAHDQTIKQ